MPFIDQNRIQAVDCVGLSVCCTISLWVME